MLFTQDVYSVNKVDYDAQEAQCNLTIQHAVAAVVPNVPPERVTDIVVEEEEEERRGNMRALLTSGLSRVSLKYKVTLYDPVLSAEVFMQQLIDKVQSGDMNHAMRNFALLFNASIMQNCTLSAPRITVLTTLNQAYQGDPATSGEVAGFVLGGFLFVVMLTVGVWLFVMFLKKEEREGNRKQQLQSATLALAA